MLRRSIRSFDKQLHKTPVLLKETNKIVEKQIFKCQQLIKLTNSFLTNINIRYSCVLSKKKRKNI